MYISSQSKNWFGVLRSTKSSSKSEAFPLCAGKQPFLFFSGRYALSASFKALGLQRGDTVLVPSYNCWVEIDSVLARGLRPKFYRVRRDLLPDLDHIRTSMDDGKTKALLSIHYMGFPQPVEELKSICKSRGIFLIEDCAHAFLSSLGGRPLGSFGDASIFSFRKSLPVADGAAMVVNRPHEFNWIGSHHPNLFCILYVYSELMRFQTSAQGSRLKTLPKYGVNRALHGSFLVSRALMRTFHKVAGDKGLYLTYPSGNTYRKAIEDWTMSSLSRRVMAASDFPEILRRRRRNFQYLLEHFQGDRRVRLIFHKLEEGVCPLFFPLIIEKRDQVYKALKRKGVAGHDWWGDFHPAVDWVQFPDSVFLKKHVLGLPCHQDLDLFELRVVTEEFDKVCGELGL